MLDDIKSILRESPGLKGREISKKLNRDRKEVNSYLSKNHDGLYQNDWKWYLIKREGTIFELKCDSWLSCGSFEESYSEVADLFKSGEEKITINFPCDFKVLLIAGARIIALVNQLNHCGKKVTLNFENCKSSTSYLSRLGFFDHIHQDVEVLPSRPKESRAEQYKGNSNNIVELGVIDLNEFNDDLPEGLTKAFVAHAGQEYYMAAFTVFSELIGNVQEHSETPIPGFAALQLYKGKRKHIQIVISDHGLGLSNTLKEGLAEHYPEFASSLDFDNVESDIFLVKKALTEGKLSRFGHNPDAVARGLGLKRSQEYALKYNAEITIRQSSFLLKLKFEKGNLIESDHKTNLSRLEGTHVCFDFFLD